MATTVQVTTSELPLRQVTLRQVVSAAATGRALGVLDTLASAGAPVRVNVALSRPYLLSHPDHIRQVCPPRNSAGAPVLVRGGMMWAPFRRLTGRGIAGEGSQWAASREALQPAFGSTHIASLMNTMIAVINAAVDTLGTRAANGAPVDGAVEMTRIVQRTVDTIFFGGRISESDGDRVGEAVSVAMAALNSRMLAPWVPLWVPMPGDRRFKKAAKTVNEILTPIVKQVRLEGGRGADVMSRLLAGTYDGKPLTDSQIRDDLVALFVAGSESSAIGLTWLWVALARHPDVTQRMVAEIDRVLAGGPVQAEHAGALPYTTMVIEETLRKYSVGWVVPRMAAADTEVGGVLIPAGSTVLISPYLTHRLQEFWPDPERFDPERFTKEAKRQRHPLAYIPFGTGAHGCLGEQLFRVEATLVAAALLSRFRVEVLNVGAVRADLSLTYRPAPGSVRLRLIPR